MKNLVSRLFYLCYDPVVIVSLSLHLNSCLSMVLVHCPSHPPGNLKHDLSCWVVAELLMAMKTLSRIHLSQILTCMFYESSQLVRFIIRIWMLYNFIWNMNNGFKLIVLGEKKKNFQVMQIMMFLKIKDRKNGIEVHDYTN